MSLVTQQNENILGGISQQPPQQRDPSQGQAMSNGFDSVVHGKQKRPPTQHVVVLDPSISGYDSAFMHEINRDSSERYQVIIVNGTLEVFDALTGVSYPVQFPNGTGYLTQQVTPSTDVIVYDDFLYPTIGALLSAQTNLQGYTWVLKHGTSPDLVDLAGIMEVQGFLDGGMLVLSHGIPVADYIVQCDVVHWTTHTDLTTLFARCPNNTVGDTNGYKLGIQVNKLTLDCSKSGTPAFGQQTYTPGTSFSGTHTFGLQIVGNVIDLLVDGVSVLTYTDTSNAGGAAFTAPGYAGIGGNQSGNGTPSNRMEHWKARYYHSSDIPAPTPTTDVPLGFRAVTIGDYTFIVNQSVEVGRKLLKSPKQPTDALIAIRQADYGTAYTITINGITVGITTAIASTTDARLQLSTDAVTGYLIAAIQANATLNAAFTCTQFGSTIYLVKNDGLDYTLTVSDGLADQAIVAIKGTVQNFDLLPARAPNGYLVQVTGDPSNLFDNYWVSYNDQGQPQQNGVWLETVGPGEMIALDPSTMPHQLVRMGSLLVGYPNAGTPPLPAITAGHAASTPYGVDGQPATTRNGIGDHAHFDTITPTLDGTQVQLTFTYDILAAVVPQGDSMTVQISKDVSGTVTAMGSQTYSGGFNVYNQSQTFTVSDANGTAYQIELLYSTGSTIAPPHQGLVYLHAKTDPTGIPLLAVTSYKSAVFTFSKTQVYPNGTVIVVQGKSYTLTADLTGIALAAALAGLTYTNYTPSNPSTGVLSLLYTPSGPAPTGTCTITWPQNTVFSNPNIGLTPGGLIGKLLKNDTDGSSGTVTANTATTITVAVLSGGVDNVFNPGDECHVVDTASKYFVFQEAPWTTRQVGDLNTNPFPSFTGETIAEVFFVKDRLGCLSRDHVILSGADDLYNFFRTTVTDLLDADMIDVQSASQQVSDFSSAVFWQEGTYLFADTVQTELVGEPILSPKTIALVPKTYYPCSKIRPIAMDRRVFFARQRSSACQIFRLERIKFPLVGLEASDAAKAIPTYITGAPLKLAGDPALEIIAVLADGAPNSVFIYQYHYEASDLVQESWHRWDFDPSVQVINIDMLDGVLNLILLRSDGVYLEKVDMQVSLYDSI